MGGIDLPVAEAGALIDDGRAPGNHAPASEPPVIEIALSRNASLPASGDIEKHTFHVTLCYTCLMASIYQRKRSKFWMARFKDPHPGLG